MSIPNSLTIPSPILPLGNLCPLTEEWIKKIWYIYTVEYYSAIKRNKIMPFAAVRMGPEIPYGMTSMLNVKYSTNERTLKTETDS